MCKRTASLQIPQTQERQTERPYQKRKTDRQTNMQAGRQTDRQADRQAGTQADRQADRQTDRQTKINDKNEKPIASTHDGQTYIKFMNSTNSSKTLMKRPQARTNSSCQYGCDPHRGGGQTLHPQVLTVCPTVRSNGLAWPSPADSRWPPTMLVNITLKWQFQTLARGRHRKSSRRFLPRISHLSAVL